MRAIIFFLTSAALLLAFGCKPGDQPDPTLEVLSISPADKSVLVSQQNATVSFNEDVAPESIIGRNSIFIVNRNNQLMRVSIAVSGANVTLTPQGGFASGSTYGLGVTTGVRNLKGAGLKYPRASRFSTGDTLSEIPGFPPFTIYPLPPDPSKITALIRGPIIEVRGEPDSVERPSDGSPVNVNVRNRTSGGAWVAVPAAADGAFTCDLPAGHEGDEIEISASFPWNGTTGPSVLLFAAFPFSWSPLSASGTAPSARQGLSAVYDSSGSRMMLFGGCTNSFGFGGATNGLFALSLANGAETWSEITASGSAPSPRFGHSAVVDSTRGRMIVFGGDNGALGVLSDVWELDLIPGNEAWAQILPAGTPPPARAFHCAIFDTSGPRMIVFCGRGATGIQPPQFDDAWSLELPSSASPSWVQISPSGTAPIARNGAFAVADAGGQNFYAGFGSNGLLFLPDTYSFSLQAQTWSPILSVPSSSGRAWSCAVFDSSFGRVLVFGGADSSQVFQDLFEYSPSASAWKTLSPEGDAPPARAAAAMVFDAANGRSILFGGREGLTGPVFADLYQLK